MKRMFRQIQCSFWTDAKVVDDFSPEDRYFYLYLMTNPHTSLTGCYQISVKQMSIETGYTEDVVRTLLDRMERLHDVVRYSEETKEVLILNWSKYNWSASEKMMKGVEGQVQEVKSDEFRDYLFKRIQGEDRVCIPYQNKNIGYVYPIPEEKKEEVYGMYTTNTNTITNTISNTNKKERKKSQFIPPTLDEIKEYIQEKKLNVDAKKFYEYYTVSNWVDGKGNKVRNWKQKLLAVWDKPMQGKPNYSGEEMEAKDRDMDELRKKMFGNG